MTIVFEFIGSQLPQESKCYIQIQKFMHHGLKWLMKLSGLKWLMKLWLMKISGHTQWSRYHVVTDTVCESTRHGMHNIYLFRYNHSPWNDYNEH